VVAVNDEAKVGVDENLLVRLDVVLLDPGYPQHRLDADCLSG